MKACSPEWRRRWLDNHLALEPYHKGVRLIEDSLWRFCCGFADTPARGRRLVLYGNNGCGKSRCARRVKRWVDTRAIDMPLTLHDDNACLCRAMLINWAERVDELKAGDWSIEPLLDADLLIVDDIGAEHDPSKVGLEKLYLILERREFQWTLITTNKSPSAWEKAFERRVADRLFRNAEHVDLSEMPSYATT